MKTGKEWQKIGEICWCFWDKFLVIPTFNSKYMPCLPNAALSQDGNVPGIALWFRKTQGLQDFRQKLSYCVK